jgi:hypothetical protein
MHAKMVAMTTFFISVTAWSHLIHLR